MEPLFCEHDLRGEPISERMFADRLKKFISEWYS